MPTQTKDGLTVKSFINSPIISVSIYNLGFYSHKPNVFLAEYRRQAFREGIQKIADQTCITFEEANASTKIFLLIKSDAPGCWADFGYSTYWQMELNLEEPGCYWDHLYQHEMLHSLGFGHMHQEPSRDEYIKINWENIDPDMYSQFDLFDPANYQNFGIPYDYNSIMHYDDLGFSKNGKPTMAKWVDDGEPLGWIGKLTDSDVYKAKALYEC